MIRGTMATMPTAIGMVEKKKEKEKEKETPG
jgi:hypothetical protein